MLVNYHINKILKEKTITSYLEEKGIFTSADYEILTYQNIEKVNLIQELIAAAVLVQMSVLLAQAIKDAADTVSDITATATGSASTGIPARSRAICPQLHCRWQG